MKIKRIAAATLAATMMVGTGAVAASAKTLTSANIYLDTQGTYLCKGDDKMNACYITAGSSGNKAICNVVKPTAQQAKDFNLVWAPGYDNVYNGITTTDVEGNCKFSHKYNGYRADLPHSLKTDGGRELKRAYVNVQYNVVGLEFSASIYKKPEPPKTTTPTRAC